MGTDIHIAVEARYAGRLTGKHGVGKWRAVPIPPGPADNYGTPEYDSRDYALFSFLSDVRYGCTMRGQIPTRGLPADVDKDSKSFSFDEIANSGVASIFESDPSEGYWVGDYGHTWATVDELLNLPWDEAMTDYGGEGVVNQTMREHSAGFVAWLEELNRLYGRENCRVIWGFDS